LVAKQDRVATVFARGTENATAGFGTLDLGATWAYAKDQSLRVALKNVGDKAYHEHLAEGVSGQEIEAPGRSLQLVWRGKF
jgi:hemoglobin/transferrin/lactoferrin receptor protein